MILTHESDRRNRTSTHPSHSDPRLRGRAYGVPFEAVWTSALRLAEGGLKGWTLIRSDDGPGVIQAEVQPRLWGPTGDVLVRVGLDAEGQTRVDLSSSSRGRLSDFGASRRRAAAFLRAMDKAVFAGVGAVATPAGR